MRKTSLRNRVIPELRGVSSSEGRLLSAPVAKPAILHARIPTKITAFPPERFLCVHHLAFVGIPAGQTRPHEAPHSGARFRSAGSCFGSPCLRTTMASRSAHCRHRRRSHSDRRIRQALLSAQCVGCDAESCAFVDVSHGPGSGAHEMVERIDGQKCEPDHGPDRAAVLARRVVGSLPARLQSTQPDRGVYRKQPGFRRAGLLRGALALVQCRLAGETACPTKPCEQLVVWVGRAVSLAIVTPPKVFQTSAWCHRAWGYCGSQRPSPKLTHGAVLPTNRLQPMSGWIKLMRRRRLKPTLQTEVRATKST
jgi:hypothetical protein